MCLSDLAEILEDINGLLAAVPVGINTREFQGIILAVNTRLLQVSVAAETCSKQQKHPRSHVDESHFKRPHGRHGGGGVGSVDVPVQAIERTARSREMQCSGKPFECNSWRSIRKEAVSIGFQSGLVIQQNQVVTCLLERPQTLCRPCRECIRGLV